MTTIPIAELRQVIGLRNLGMSMEAIAKECGRSYNWVRRRLLQVGDPEIGKRAKPRTKGPKCSCCQILLKYAGPADEKGRCQYCQDEGWVRVNGQWMVTHD